MSHCDAHHANHYPDRADAYRRVIAICLLLNFGMFVAEIIISILSGSLALLADAIDFLSDAAVFAATLLALRVGGRSRSWTAIFDALLMITLGSYVLVEGIARLQEPVLPMSLYMMLTALLALAVNGYCTYLLARFRGDDANSRAVWLCSRNDAIANLSVMASGALVALTHTPWPDLIVAAGLSALAIYSGLSILVQAWRELHPKTP